MLDLNNFPIPSDNDPPDFAPLNRSERKDLSVSSNHNLADLALPARSEQRDPPCFDLFQQLVLWLSNSLHSSRKGRHYLENNPTLLESETDRELARLIIAEAEDKPEMKQQMNNHLALLQDARRRGGTTLAVRDAYVDIYGGFALDLPYWLEQIEQQRNFLQQLQRPERTKRTHITLLQGAIARALQDRSIAPEIVAELQNELGVLLLQGAYQLTQASHRQAIQDAITYHRAALTTYTSTRYPLQHAKTQMHLGIAYQHYSLTGQRDALEYAISCYESALQIYRQDTCPEQWATLQTYLGNAYTRRTSGNPAANKERAIAHHNAALQLLAAHHGSSPALLATIQVNLGDTYRQRITGNRSDNLQQAMTYYRAALQTFTPQSYPYEWASIHTRLAAIFQENNVEHVEQRDKCLRCAIVCYEEALQVYTPDSFPVERAATLVNLGNVHRMRSGSDPLQNFEQAVKCYYAVLHVFTDNTFPTEHRQTLHYLAEAEAQRQALLQQGQETQQVIP